jgi:UDP-N-acetylmuramate--alanine ligase
MRVLLAGGGTAGHVNPLLATATELRRRERGVQLLVLGTREGLEARLVPAQDLDLATIARVPFPRSLNLRALRFPAAFWGAVAQTRTHIREFRPDVVVGFGGYVSTPAYLAAKREGVPVVVHEGNARPGLANKLGAKNAHAVAVTFPGTPLPRALLTGLPLRPALATISRRDDRAAARQELGLAQDGPVLLVAGGSLGALALNRALIDVAPALVDAGVQVLHLAGRSKADEVRQGVESVSGPGAYHVLEYLDRMELALAAADLAVQRAGAASVSELAAAGLPSVLVPLTVGNGEQHRNAAGLVAAGGAVEVANSDFAAWAPGNLLDLIQDAPALERMGLAASSVAIRDAAARLADLIEEAAAAALPKARSKAAPSPTAPSPTAQDHPDAAPQAQGPSQDHESADHLPKYHLMGAGGVGMAALAELLLAQPARVSGCDAKGGPTLDRLAEIGVETHVGHDPAHLDPDTTVVISSAIRESNPELAAARDRGLRVLHRSRALAQLARDRGSDLIAVAGTHGKTTTTAMLAGALVRSETDPSYGIGGQIVGQASGAHLGQGRHFVIEADESDGSFLNYAPALAIITNVEGDHLDYYGTEQAVIAAFRAFVDRIRPGGTLVACADDPGAAGIARYARDHGIATVTYGRTQAADVRVQAGDQPLAVRLQGQAADVAIADELHLAQGGWHTKLDAAAAYVAARLLGCPAAPVREALEGFAGTARRFSLTGEAGGVRVYDDYAHHPTEIAATLRGARETARGRVLVVFQPHLYSRTQAFAQQFAEALGLADLALVMDVYAAREDPVEGVDGALIVRAADPAKARHVPEPERVVRELVRAARPGDLIITLGAGDVTDLGPALVAALGGEAGSGEGTDSEAAS